MKTIEDAVDTEGKVVGLCGKCRKYMRIYTKTNLMTCQDCGLKVSFPQNSKVKQLNLKCKEHGTDRVGYSMGVSHQQEVFVDACPHCFRWVWVNWQ